MKTDVTIKIDTDDLRSVTDTYLASLWHVAQANPADPLRPRGSGKLTEHIGREIIARFLRRTPPELCSHDGSAYGSNRSLAAKHPEPSAREAEVGTMEATISGSKTQAAGVRS